MPVQTELPDAPPERAPLPERAPPPERAPDVFAAACPSREMLRAMTSRWGVLVLVALLDGTQRFSQLRRRITGISERMLAQSLKELEQHGLVHRHAHPVVPPHVDYHLTPAGREAAGRMRDLVNWIETHIAAGA